jgi:enoyl-CoA hydratase/carnithine racemase
MPDASQTAAATPQGSEDLVLRQDAGAIARVTMNRPKAYNALSLDMMRALTGTLEEIGRDTAIRCVVLEGAGKGFCSGHDLKELRSRTDRAFYEEVFETCSQLMTTITRLPQPVIAKVHGIATAAGCQLVATCDLAVAADTARFATPGVNIGLFCSTPMVALSRNVPRKRAMEMLLTGEMVSAPVAAQWALINEAVDHDGLDETVERYAQAVASKSPHVLKIGKRAFYEQLDQSLDEAYRHTAQVMTENMLHRDATEGIDAFLEKREPQWTGA